MYYIYPNGTISPVLAYSVDNSTFRHRITIILPIETLQFYHEDYECLLTHIKSYNYIKQYHLEHLI